MSFKKQGQLSKSPERHKHLGDFLSRLFWKRERKAEKELINQELAETENDIKNLNYQFSELIMTLIALSSPADKQREIYGEAPPGDEMLEDFYSYYTLIKSLLLEKGLIDHGSVDLLDKLDKFTFEKSNEKDSEFWDDLEQHQDWEKIRDLAKLCLIKLGKENCRLKVTHVYEWDDKGTVRSQVSKRELLKQNDRQQSI